MSNKITPNIMNVELDRVVTIREMVDQFEDTLSSTSGHLNTELGERFPELTLDQEEGLSELIQEIMRDEIESRLQSISAESEDIC